ncbi:hypothetical protein CSOJ01_08335 [Colletotrichum sojae]|uniref:Uncharacterized protein n=1 Tax=Colletotrichum sojae TaxID=2175907 RepID=A0A8H6MS83_9PEZI|nr:hypothetical protein CSOJ01_08335 [Colletotrichum sojae]
MELGESIRPRTLFRTLRWPSRHTLTLVAWHVATVIGQAFQSCTIGYPWPLGGLGRSHGPSTLAPT